MLNLYSLAAADSTKYTVLHPVSKAPTDMVLTLAGPASEAYHMEKLRSTKARFSQDAQITVEALDEAATDLLTACVLDWQGVADASGSPIPCNKETVRTLLMDRKFYWLRTQIDQAVAEVANFIKA